MACYEGYEARKEREKKELSNTLMSLICSTVALD